MMSLLLLSMLLLVNDVVARTCKCFAFRPNSSNVIVGGCVVDNDQYFPDWCRLANESTGICDEWRGRDGGGRLCCCDNGDNSGCNNDKLIKQLHYSTCRVMTARKDDAAPPPAVYQACNLASSHVCTTLETEDGNFHADCTSRNDTAVCVEKLPPTGVGGWECVEDGATKNNHCCCNTSNCNVVFIDKFINAIWTTTSTTTTTTISTTTTDTISTTTTEATSTEEAEETTVNTAIELTTIVTTATITDETTTTISTAETTTLMDVTSAEGQMTIDAAVHHAEKKEEEGVDWLVWGLVMGGVALLVIAGLIAVIWWQCRRSKKRKEEMQRAAAAEEETSSTKYSDGDDDKDGENENTGDSLGTGTEKTESCTGTAGDDSIKEDTRSATL